MTIIEYVAIISLMSGLQFLLTVILPIGLTLAGCLFLIDRARIIVYRAGVDYLELVARLDSLRDDHARRELAIAEAGLALRARRLELRERLPE